MIDPLLLEAMREVDALTPACPPIAPPQRCPLDTYGEGPCLLGAGHAGSCAGPFEAWRPRTDNATQVQAGEMVEYADVAWRARIRG